MKLLVNRLVGKIDVNDLSTIENEYLKYKSVFVFLIVLKWKTEIETQQGIREAWLSLLACMNP